MRKSPGIAVIRTGAIGDSLVMFPLLAALRAAHRDARIVALGRREVFALAVEDCLCDAAISPDAAALWRLASAEHEIGEEERHVFGGISVVYDFDGEGLPAERARELGVGEWRRLRPLPPTDFERPAAAFYLEQAGFEAAPPFTVSPRRAAAFGASGAFVVAPGAGSPRKRAPASWFAEASRGARAAGREVALVSGEADGAAVDEFRAQGGVADEVWDSLPLGELRERMRSARFFVANDSGIAHLAASVGLPGLVRFVATDPRVWAPPFPGVVPIGPPRGGTPPSSRARAR